MQDAPRRERVATVAIVGRPNVGKSALFNRLVGTRMAIVDDQPGVTRDRLVALAEWRGHTFAIVDTGGIETGSALRDHILASTRKQAEIAAHDADVIIFVVDAETGLNPVDEDVAQFLRKLRRPVILVANKAETAGRRNQIAADFMRLGFGEPFAVSAIHGEGTGDLLDDVLEKLPSDTGPPVAEDEVAVAFIGRPNVGKSTLHNALIGEERSIVSDIPGTTRDAIDTIFDYEGRRLRLIDTAGMRKHVNRNAEAVEYYSSLRSLQAITRSNVVVLLLDSTEGVLAQDRRLAGLILEERRGLVIAYNKWDIVRELGSFEQKELTEETYKALPFARFAPVVYFSAKTKRSLNRLMPTVMMVSENLDRRIPTAKVNAVIRDAVLAHPPPSQSGRNARIYYCAQVSTRPPLFIFHCNDPELVKPSYRRFLENVLRTNFDFTGVPLSFQFRERSAAELDA